MSEMDDLYGRLVADPSLIDDPLLARAIRAAEPNRDLAAAYDKQVTENHRLRTGAADALAALQVRVAADKARIDRLTGELAKSERRRAEAEAKVPVVPGPAREVRLDLDERRQLAELGWEKGV